MKYGLRMALALGVAAICQPVSAGAPPAAPIGYKAKADGTLVHKASGTRFPDHFGGFTRFSSSSYDVKGHDAVISYHEQVGGKPVVARIALIHIVGMTPKEHFLGLKTMVGSYFQDLAFSHVQPQGEGPFILPGDGKLIGYQGRFRAMQGRVPYELSLTTVNFGYWSARLTAAYPRSAAVQAQEDIRALAAFLLRKPPHR